MDKAKLRDDRKIRKFQNEVCDLVLTDHVQLKIGLSSGLVHKYHDPILTMALICNCDLTEITGPSRNIFITNFSIQRFGRRTGERFISHMTENNLNNNLPWGPVHHAKVLFSKDSPTSTTKGMFLRFCNPACHADIFEDLNGLEWPVGLGRTLRMEFNRNYTQTHQLLSGERFQFKEMATQTSDQIVRKINNLGPRQHLVNFVIGVATRL
ncbi:unnamed protein product [Brachionus calyciflorus]|uniref:RRM domain-containing protein n=1 Tax=Brachionus calyciflorus TaxID=104777 RepID=A0A814CF93_9BILA|nr:unnamed protein product [Brachionus calyciflorus]